MTTINMGTCWLKN